MNARAKLAAYGVAVAVLATGAYVVGNAVGPLPTTVSADAVAGAHEGMAPEPAAAELDTSAMRFVPLAF